MKRNIDFLLRRGFSYSAASGAIRQLLELAEESELLDEGASDSSS